MISKETVQHIANLAKLELSDDEAIVYAKQIGSIVNYFDELKAIDLSNVKPLITPVEIEQKLRADQVAVGLSAEEIIQNAPDVAGHLFKVPPVV